MMGIHVILLVSSLVVSICLLVDALTWDENYLVAMVSVIITILLFVFLMVGVTKLQNSQWVYSDEPYSVENIIALNDNNMTNGRFYVRSGYIESDLYYQYIVTLRSGGYVTNKVKSDTATIFYDDDNYRVEWYTRTKGWLYFKASESYQKIYIPEGSLTDTYSVDLQ